MGDDWGVHGGRGLHAVAAAAACRGGHDLDEAVEEAEDLVDGGEAEEADGYAYDCRGMEVVSHEAEAEEWRSL